MGGRVTDNTEDNKVVIRGFVSTDHVPILPVPLLSFASDREGRRRRGGGGLIVVKHHGPACIIGVDGQRGGGRDIVVVVELHRR